MNEALNRTPGNSNALEFHDWTWGSRGAPAELDVVRFKRRNPIFENIFYQFRGWTSRTTDQLRVGLVVACGNGNQSSKSQVKQNKMSGEV
jgi:hypothetical protein